jgi:ribonucleotide reductase beta subunit family protein with ferritin-like domain
MVNIIDVLKNGLEKYSDEDLQKIKDIVVSIDSKYPDNKSEDEPLTSIKHKKYTAFPIMYQDVWDEYKNQMACYWKAEEVDFSNDYNDFMTLDSDEQHFIKMILAFFAASDGIVNFNLSERFIREITVSEVLFTYQFQAMMENVHGIVYSLMLDNIVKDPKERNMLFNAITTIPSVKLMADWSFEWIESDKSFAHRLVAFAIVEGIFFSGAFAAIFWLKKYKHPNNAKPFMNGLITSNKFISRDEGLHYKFACVLYKHIKNKLSQDEIEKILTPAVKIAKQFMVDAIPIRLIGMNNDAMNDYIEYISDMLLTMMGYSKIYKKGNPFKFMETIGLNDKTNFFDLRAHEYTDAHVNNKKNKIEILDSF